MLQVRSYSTLQYHQTIQKKRARLLGPPHHICLQHYPLSIRPAVITEPVPQRTAVQYSPQSHSKSCSSIEIDVRTSWRQTCLKGEIKLMVSNHPCSAQFVGTFVSMHGWIRWTHCSTAMSTQPARHSGFFAWFILLWPRHDHFSSQIKMKRGAFWKTNQFVVTGPNSKIIFWNQFWLSLLQLKILSI